MHYLPDTTRRMLEEGLAEPAADNSQSTGYHWQSAPLYALTLAVAVLLGLDVLLGAVGTPEWLAWRQVGGFRLALLAAVLGGSRILFQTLDGLFQGRVGADLALSIACLAAILLGEPQVAALVVLIALIGESLEGYTVDRAVQALRGACELFPAVAHRLDPRGETDVAIEALKVDDAIMVRPGERLPADGVVRRGHTVVDHSPLTGESLPVDRTVGDRVYAGTLNGPGAIEVTVCCVGAQTAVGQISRLVAQAHQNKAPLEREADRLARYFLPVVLGAAALTLVGWRWRTGNWSAGWMPALAVLVVACPCPLVLATPSAVLAALAWLARHGIVIKGSAALEQLASVDTLAFDKTGTLTTGALQVGRTLSAPLPEREFHRLAACAARASQHPVSRLLLTHAERQGVVLPDLLQSHEEPGLGVAVRLPADDPALSLLAPPGPAALSATAEPSLEPWLLLGNGRWLSLCGIEGTSGQQAELDALEAAGESPVQLALAWRSAGAPREAEVSPGGRLPGGFDTQTLTHGQWLGCVGVTDTPRTHAAEVVRELREGGIGEIVLLTGDRPGAARELSARLPGVDAWQGGLLPQDKAAWVEQRQQAGRRVAMVGDGINDAPALKSATVGVAVAQAGANLAAEAGDVILLGDPLAALPGLLRLSRALVSNIRRSILWFGFGFNALGVLLSAWGWLSPVASAVMHEAGSLLVMLHALRLLWFERQAPAAWSRWSGTVQATAGWLVDWVSPSGWIFRLLRHRRKLLPLTACLLTAWWLTRNLVMLQPDEQALVHRLGRHQDILGPGYWWRWPPPLETLRRERPDRLQALALGFRAAPRPVTTPGEYRAPVEWQTTHEDQGYLMLPDEALLLTGDELLVELTAEAQWQITDLREFARQSAEPAAILRGLVESAVREVVARKSLEELLGAGRREWEADCLQAARAALARHHLGLRLVSLNLLEVHPPGGVVPSYRDVANALEEREQLLNLGQTQAARTLLATAGEPALAAFNPNSGSDTGESPADPGPGQPAESRSPTPSAPRATPGAPEADTRPGSAGPPSGSAPRVPDALWRAISADHPSDLEPGTRPTQAPAANNQPAPAATARLAGRAAETLHRARADRAVKQLTAQGQADRFRAVQQPHAAHPQLTLLHLYWQSLEQTLANRPLLIVDPQAAGRRQIWLNESGLSPTEVPAPPEATLPTRRSNRPPPLADDDDTQ